MSKAQPTTQEFLHGTADEKEFFARVFLPNRTVKTTHANRLDDVNAAALPLITALSPRPLRILDVAVSSGISTAEWHQFLWSRGVAHKMTATDLAINATLVNSKRFALLRDTQGSLLHFDMFGVGWPPHQHGFHFHALRHALAVSAVGVSALFGRACLQKVHLITNRLNGNIQVREDDLTAANPPDFVRAFDVIRAANILNLAYLPESTLRLVIDNLKQRLAPSGLLIICRTIKGEGNHGTIFKDSLPITRIGKGSEVEHLI